MATLVRRPPEWIHQAPFRASATRMVPAPPDEVFAALADHETWPEWFESIDAVERFGDLHEGLGSNRRVHINARISAEEEFHVWEPGEAWGFVVLSTTMPGIRSMVELVTIDDLEDGRSRVTYTMGIDARFPLSLLLRAARAGVAKNLGRALENLGPHIDRRRASFS